jgi:Tfp pilus assembly protein FimT
VFPGRLFAARQTGNRGRTYTLIELLVIIAILAERPEL